MSDIRLQTLAIIAIAFTGATANSIAAEQDEGVIHVPAFDLPRSGLLSDETLSVLRWRSKELAEARNACPANQGIVAQRQCLEKNYYPKIIARHQARYQVTIQPQTIGGVATEVFTPAEGVAAGARNRILINLHGGGFINGGRWGGEIESIPIAAVAKIKVVSVDYRLAPEHHFPAASEDVAKVYRALLREHKPENIGIYGCSAGGILTAEAVAWFQKEKLPRPGAIGLFCAGALSFDDNDSSRIAAAFAGSPSARNRNPYFTDADLENPLAFPGLAPDIMSRFPPTLLITATRDSAMSPTVATHAQLVRLGVLAELHVWEGLEHAFFFEPSLPESREVYDVIARFFKQHLGVPPAPPQVRE